MLNVESVERLVLEACSVGGRTTVDLAKGWGRVPAEDVFSPVDVPPFHRAMMDGFALRAADVAAAPAELAVIAEVPAGASSQAELQPGQAVRIMTGAPLPAGADAVQMKECCEESAGGTVRVLESLAPWRNVARQGSERAQGAPVLFAGVPLGAAHLGIAATIGLSRLPVFERPRVRLVNTGSELVEAGEPIEGGKIWNSNRHTLTNVLAAEGFAPEWGGTAADEKAAIHAAVDAAEAADFLLLTGGVSVGEYDLVAEAVAEAGWEVLIRAVAMKPGKPMVFARKGRRCLFGLSGNPVSSMLQAVCFVLPALRKAAGWRNPRPERWSVRLAGPVRHNPGRLSLKPGRLVFEDDGMRVLPLADKGSADLFAWADADVVLVIPGDVPALCLGDRVEVVGLRRR